MVGVVIVAHCGLAEELVKTSEFIVGRMEKTEWVSVKENDKVDKMRKEIANAIKKVDSGRGVLILTDMFGGSPANVSLSFLEEGRVEVLMGVNLPIILKFHAIRKEKKLEEIAHALEEYGKWSVALASDVLKGKRKEAK